MERVDIIVYKAPFFSFNRAGAGKEKLHISKPITCPPNHSWQSGATIEPNFRPLLSNMFRKTAQLLYKCVGSTSVNDLAPEWQKPVHEVLEQLERSVSTCSCLITQSKGNRLIRSHRIRSLRTQRSSGIAPLCRPSVAYLT